MLHVFFGQMPKFSIGMNVVIIYFHFHHFHITHIVIKIHSTFYIAMNLHNYILLNNYFNTFFLEYAYVLQVLFRQMPKFSTRLNDVTTNFHFHHFHMTQTIIKMNPTFSITMNLHVIFSLKTTSTSFL